jgi:very-short-patch-repair endonuclease
VRRYAGTNTSRGSQREQALARIAARQDNVVTWHQVCQVGLGRGWLAHRIEVGTMQRLHRGVYLLGAAHPTPFVRCRAAVLACGDGAMLSHLSAAAAWKMVAVVEAEVGVTVLGRKPRQRARIRIHRVSTLAARDVRTLRGVRLTSPARTICDLAASEPIETAERAYSEALVLRLLTPAQLADAAGRVAANRGAAAVRRLLAGGPRITRSEAERRLLGLVARAGLPPPQTNVKLHGYRVDFVWPEHRLIIEVDGFQFHGHRRAFEQDRMRDQVLIARGYRVIRITWRQLTGEPLAVLARIAQALVHRAA